MKEKENNVSTREHRAYERNLIYDVYIDIITILGMESIFENQFIHLS